MINVDKANVVKLKLSGHNFELLIDSDRAVDFKKGLITDVLEVIAVEKVFADAKKGMEASQTVIKNCFNTDDILEVAKQIIEKGEFGVSADYKAKLREQKRKQIIDYIHANAVDPKTHNPHPVQRIELAFESEKITVDESKDIKTQTDEIIKKLLPILPLKFEIKEIIVKIPKEFASKSYNVLNNFGKKTKEDWLSDGSLSVTLEMPGGLEEDFYEKINAICHGNIEAKVLSVR